MDKEQQIIEDYLNYMSWEELQKKYRTNSKTIYKILSKHDIGKRPIKQSNSWSIEKQELLREMYMRNCTYPEMYEALDCKGGTLTYWVRKLGLPMRGSGRYNIYKNPFINITPERDYWLGYLFADGHIGQNHIELCSKEESVANAFNEFCYNQCKIYKKPYITLAGETRTIYRVMLQSIDLYRWFVETYKVDSKKHHTLNPDIELNWNIVKGYFDGDGNAHKNGGWTITSCSKKWIDKVKDFLTENDIYSSINEYKKCYKLSVWRKEELHKLVPLMYRDDTFCLEYKYKRLEPYGSNFICKQGELLEG